MGNLFSKLTSKTTTQDKINDIIDYCETEEPALKNIAEMAKQITTTDKIESLRTLYLKSIEYINCNNANSQLLKSQIFNLYQDLIVEQAVELLNHIKEWKLPPISPDAKEEEINQIHLNSIQLRIKELCEAIVKLSEISKYYIRKDTQISEIIDFIKLLQDNTNGQLSVISEAVDVYKARYLFGIIICNYTTGSISASVERYENDLDTYLTVNTYKGCLMFSEFIPLLWMTEPDFWNLNEMKNKNTTSSTISDEDIELYLKQGYLKKCLINLAKYYSNSFWPKYDAAQIGTAFRNCDYNPCYSKADNFSTLHDIVSPFVDNINIKTWKDFFEHGRKILNKIDTHHIKMLPYMAQKNNFAISGEFMKIPETWPKYDHDIELFEAIVSVANICFANCGGDNSKELDSNTGMYVPLNRGGYTYKDLGLYNQNLRYFDQRAFILVPDDTAFNKIPNNNKTSKFVKALDLDSESKWNDFVLKLDANINDAKFGQDTKSNYRKCIYNNTGYFTDKIYNCIDSSYFIKTDEFPIIPGLSAYRLKTNSQNAKASETYIELPENELKFEKMIVEDFIKSKNFMSLSEINELNNHEIHNIYKSICMESFNISDKTIQYGKNIIINGSEYTINPIVKTFYDDIKISTTTSKLYLSNNTKLFSSIDYLTNDGNSYAKNPSIPYFVYYNLIPKSLDFELMIPFIPPNFKTNMTICGCDKLNECPDNSLIPFVFSYQIKNGITIDPLFEIDNVDSVKNVELLKETFEESEESEESEENEESEDCEEEQKEGFIDKVVNFLF